MGGNGPWVDFTLLVPMAYTTIDIFPVKIRYSAMNVIPAKAGTSCRCRNLKHLYDQTLCGRTEVPGSATRGPGMTEIKKNVIATKNSASLPLLYVHLLIWFPIL